jgi:hypothetical protein
MAEAYDKLIDTSYWIDAATTFGGFMAASVIGGLAPTRMGGMQVPPAAYGAAVVVGVEFAPGVTRKQKRMAQIGAGLHTVDAAASRFEKRRGPFRVLSRFGLDSQTWSVKSGAASRCRMP